VIEYIGIELDQPHWLLIGNKMYLVALVCKRLSQFGGQYATSSKSWITNNADPHEF
jgi:hypothetical protein